MCSSPQLFWLLLSKTFLFIASVLASSPAEIPWSSKTYGPDGPWHAVTIQVGTPPQAVDVLPQGAGACYVLTDSYCKTTKSQQCSSFAPGNSSTYDDTWSAWSDNPSWQSPVATYGKWQYSTDILSVPVQGSQSLKSNQTVQIVTSGGIELGARGQTQAPFRLGTLSLGNPTISNTIPGTSVEVNKYTTDQFAVAGDIPSASFGLHYGSVTAGVAPSLVFGGYDRSRVVGQSITTSINVDAYPQVSLSQVVIGTAAGASPWPSTAPLQGLLKADQAMTAGGLLPVKVDPGNPYILLPAETCQAIAAPLPVTYNADNQLYYWNTTDPMFELIVNGANYLGFTFASAGLPDVTIKVPFQLLNLTLESPLSTGGSTQYFPCLASTGEEFGLGRAFLQAAFYGGNWQPQNAGQSSVSTGPGAWTLAQAPGPNFGAPDVQTLAPTQNAITRSNVTWEDTWKGRWQPLAINSSLLSSQSSSSGSESADDGMTDSTGAIVGIAVGAAALVVVLVVVLAFICRRRRRRQSDQRVEETIGSRPACDKPPELHGRTAASDRAELAGMKMYAEMPTEKLRTEMSCYKEPVELAC